MPRNENLNPVFRLGPRRSEPMIIRWPAFGKLSNVEAEGRA
jgi:hypothetical protein